MHKTESPRQWIARKHQRPGFGILYLGVFEFLRDAFGGIVQVMQMEFDLPESAITQIGQMVQ
jgi:hypothetical protein